MGRFSTYTGEKVERGEVIGFVGSTGWSTGCHNHFMVLRNGRPVNPSPWLR
jgi:murein DD-endopeptidase MepM/ murein hydrolase activator NlpD